MFAPVFNILYSIQFIYVLASSNTLDYSCLVQFRQYVQSVPGNQGLNTKIDGYCFACPECKLSGLQCSYVYKGLLRYMLYNKCSYTCDTYGLLRHMLYNMCYITKQPLFNVNLIIIACKQIRTFINVRIRL